MLRPLILAAALALAAAPAARAAPPYADRVLATPGLAGYWALDEATGPRVADLRTTGEGLHSGPVRPGTAPLVPGGRSARYSGGRAATFVPNSPRLNPTRALTVEAWARPDALPHAATLAGKVGQYALGFADDGRAVLRLWSGGRMHRLAGAPDAVAAGRTVALAGTYDGRAMRLYVDGRRVAARPLRGALGKVRSALILGGGLRGRLDDVALYDRALDGATLAAHHGAGTAAPCVTQPLPVGFDALWRPACWRPYRAGSPFDQPLRPGAPQSPDSPAIVARLAGQGPPQMIYGLPTATSDPRKDAADFQHPLYSGDWLDATSPVRCVRYACPDLRGERVPLPLGARPAQASDGHLAVLDQDTGAEYDLWQVGGGDDRILKTVPDDGRRIAASGGGLTGPDEGLAWSLGSDATAAHFGLAAGVVRAPELIEGEIDHALFLVVNCADGFVAPASGLGAACDDGRGPPMGTRLRLDYSAAQIAALHAPAWKRAVLRALARYGGYVGDTGASDQAAFEVAMESGESYTSLGAPDFIGEFWSRVDGRNRFDNYRYFDLGNGVDWRRLRVVAPCVAARTC